MMGRRIGRYPRMMAAGALGYFASIFTAGVSMTMPWREFS